MAQFVYKDNKEPVNFEKNYTQAELDEAVKNALEKQKTMLLKDLADKCKEEYDRGYKQGKKDADNDGNYIFNEDFSNKSISFINGKMLVNGVEITFDSLGNKIVKKLGSITINGNVGTVTGTSGSINIKGNVTGCVTCTSGSIRCGNVSGDVRATSGVIKYNR